MLVFFRFHQLVLRLSTVELRFSVRERVEDLDSIQSLSLGYLPFSSVQRSSFLGRYGTVRTTLTKEVREKFLWIC